MDPLKVAGNISKQLSEHRANQQPKANGAKPGPTGPKKQPLQAPDTINNAHIGELEHVLCPSCHANLKKHMASKATGKEDGKHQQGIDTSKQPINLQIIHPAPNRN